jgi:hypothetical protein
MLRKYLTRASRSNTGTRFGPDIIDRFCKDNKIDLLIRAHECVDRGWQVYAEGHGITLFSAPKYGGGEDAVNSGAILEVSRDLHVQCKAISAGDTAGVWSNTDKLDKGRGVQDVKRGNSTSQ